MAKRKRLNSRRTIKKTYLIVTNGAVTEPQYFQHYEFPNLKIVVCDGSSPLETMHKAVKIAGEQRKAQARYAGVWVVVDKDNYEETEFQQAQKLGKQKNIDLIVSVPCFEIWLLWHLKECGSHLTTPQAQERFERALYAILPPDQVRKRKKTEKSRKFLPTTFPYNQWRKAKERNDKIVRSKGVPYPNPSSPVGEIMETVTKSLQ